MRCTWILHLYDDCLVESDSRIGMKMGMWLLRSFQRVIGMRGRAGTREWLFTLRSLSCDELKVILLKSSAFYVAMLPIVN